MKATAARRRRARTTGASKSKARVRLDVDERRAQLVELGLAEFGSRSYDDVSIDLIAQAAGISKGLLYHYFPTKRAFYIACLREEARRLIGSLEDAPVGVEPVERLKWGIDAYLEFVRARGPAFATLMRSTAGLDPEIGAVVDETRATLLASVTGDLATLFPAGLPALLRFALHGWIGMAEAMSIAWVEACVEAESTPDASPAPAAAEVRDVLARTFVALVGESLPPR